MDYILVRDGRLSQSKVIQLLQRYKHSYHPYFPIVPEATLDAANLSKTAREEKHLLTALSKLEAEYKGLDASYGRTHRKALKHKLERMTREVDVKRDQIYLLHDVLEGQKANGEEMTTDFVEHTIRSIFGKEETWNGIQE